MKLQWVAVAVLAALLVRVPAATSLPLDWDEPIYMEAASEVAQAIRNKDWSTALSPTLNREHPSLVKVAYGVSLVPHGTDVGLVERLASMRGISMMAGLMAVAALTWVHPAAGLVLATHTIHAKYSSQAYLDSLPMLWMTVAMLIGWKNRTAPNSRSLVVAGACWGAASAGKWLHGIPGLVLLWAIPGWRARIRLACVALAGMFVLDPSLWLDPLGRITEMVTMHVEYGAGLDATTHWWTPWIHLGNGGPSDWHPEAFPYSIDGVWLVLAGFGLWMARRTPWARYLAAWIGLPMLVLMVWGTRWPQHLMVVVAPVSLAAGVGLRQAFSLANRHFVPTEKRPPTSE